MSFREFSSLFHPFSSENLKRSFEPRRQVNRGREVGSRCRRELEGMFSYGTITGVTIVTYSEVSTIAIGLRSIRKLLNHACYVNKYVLRTCVYYETYVENSICAAMLRSLA